MKQKEPVLGWLNRLEIYPNQKGFEVYLIFRAMNRRNGLGNRYSHIQGAEYEETKIGLFHVLENLKVQDKQMLLIDLLKGGVGAIWKLGDRYNWLAYKMKKKMLVEKAKELHEKKKKRLMKKGQFVRAMDV